MFECPFCGYKTKSFWSLKHHATKKHLSSPCPVCNEEFKDIRLHAYLRAKQGDEEHIVYYGMVSRVWKDNKDFARDCRDFAYEATMVEEDFLPCADVCDFTAPNCQELPECPARQLAESLEEVEG